MTSMGHGFRARSFLTWALAFGTLAASSALLGCSSDTPATPRAFIYALVGPNPTDPNGSAKCQLGQDMSWVTIGMNEMTVADGDSQSGAGIHVSCNVHQTGPHSYAVTASASNSAQGSVTIANATLSDDVTMVQQNVTASFQRGDFGTFNESDCTFDYNGMLDMFHGAMNPNMGIAPGRVWGNLICPNAFFQQQNRTCLANAEVKFENCSQ